MTLDDLFDGLDDDLEDAVPDNPFHLYESAGLSFELAMRLDRAGDIGIRVIDAATWTSGYDRVGWKFYYVYGDWKLLALSYRDHHKSDEKFTWVKGGRAHLFRLMSGLDCDVEGDIWLDHEVAMVDVKGRVLTPGHNPQYDEPIF